MLLFFYTAFEKLKRKECCLLQMSHKLWSPPEGIRTNIDDFKDVIRQKYQVQLGIQAFRFRGMVGGENCSINLESYWDLYEWSVKNIGKFWEEFWVYSDVKYSVPFDEVGRLPGGFCLIRKR